MQVVPRLESGGVERGTVEVAQALRTRNHETVVVSQGGRLVVELDRLEIKHIHLRVAEKSPRVLTSVGKLRQLFNNQEPNVVHARSRLPAWLCWHALRGMSELTRPRFITSVQGLHSVSRYSAIVARGERIETVSETAKQYLLQNYTVSDPSIVHVIPRGVDEELFRSDYRPNDAWLSAWTEKMCQMNPHNHAVIVFPGRITRLKGHEEFLNGIENLNKNAFPCVGIVVGGEDPRHTRYLKLLQERVQNSEYLRKNIWFTGFRSDIREIFAVSDLVMSLSRKPEAFGRTVLEALSLGTPVVGFDSGGVGEILGQLFSLGAVPLGDMDSATERVVEILRSKQWSIQPHSMTLARMCDETIGMYEELAS